MDPQTKPDQVLKILLLGSPCVGKSAIFARYTNNDFIENYSPTPGLDFQQRLIELNGLKLKLSILDTAGSEEFLETTSQYLNGAHGVFIVYDVTNRKSFANCSKWIQVVDNYPNKRIVKMLVANKSDNEDKREVKYEEGYEFADEKEMPFIETSALSGSNITQAVQNLSTSILVKLGVIKEQAAPQD
ncbi:unnamed protein product (macronuclear) [Paramecium tetraurelia]|uniref:Chromosome undetermined scaffold_62, whole genome shotgun sequence n=1 Tax=Paramecium tetraurelia TaxID=5888 RepID=Q3SDU6_PARTE|nr:uncharacterized protein GSPATT00019792001 [Paramecium tetraurelia]CAI39262.1 rab_C93 [Paramecium tetraurelia]CAK86099.1 unnamed protein product [Paramecium tetraurelia]|eukprot:XP_001453496.1 hypothetical protein (macronuclear) [Paramecium tetraurelia strain d4-2]